MRTVTSASATVAAGGTLGVVLPPARPLPAAALRDALGLARVLYAAELAAGAAPERLEAIADAGRKLRLALEHLACEPDTLGRRAAPANAATGMARLSSVSWSPEVAKLVEVARAKLEPR